jgi:hypothetical protein
MARRLQGRQGRDLNLAEWNGLTYDPRTSLIMVGAIGAGAITYTVFVIGAAWFLRSCIGAKLRPPWLLFEHSGSSISA